MLKWLSPKISSSPRVLTCSFDALRHATASSSSALLPSRRIWTSQTSAPNDMAVSELLKAQHPLHLMNRLFSSDLPEHTAVALPALSPTMNKGSIISWKKKEGDQLEEGDLLCEIETDKAVMGYETPEEGYLARIFLGEGSKDIPVGKLLCIIVPEKSDVEAFANYEAPEGSVTSAQTSARPQKSHKETPAPPASPPPTVTPVTKPSEPAQMTHSTGQNRVLATPYAKKMAAEKGIDLANIAGSGPGGRVLATDVATAPAPTHVSAPATLGADQPLSHARVSMAQMAANSKVSIPHFYLSSFICLDEVLRVKDKLNELASKGKTETEVSLNDFMLKATAIACKRVPEANSFFMDTFIRQFNSVHISVGLKTPSGAVAYPTLFDADSKGLLTISQELNAMKAKVKQGEFSPQETEGGTIAVSNMGEYTSVFNFFATILPPQSCHLAIGHPKQQLLPDKESGYKTSTVLNVTLSCDHRVVDGAVGAQWLHHFKESLEKPHTMLL